VTRPPVRAVFLGTPEAAVASLVALTKVAEVAAVITRPDRPRGRSGRPLPSPVKEAATRLGIAVLQPASSSELIGALASMEEIDVGIVTAYGALVGPEALAIPSRGFLNVHFSLLPRWRGANPVVAALLAGDEETGVTLMHLDRGLDTGPIVAARTAVIGRDENGGDLTMRLANLGAELLVERLPEWIDGSLTSTSQSTIGVTYAPKLSKPDLVLDLTAPAEELARRIRALAPSPGAVLTTGDGHLRVLAGRPLDRDDPPGQMTFTDDQVVVGTGRGALVLLIVQPAGKRPMDASAWWRGLRSPPRVIGR
jgi:methionyl-tRNA formyltransferase